VLPGVSLSQILELSNESVNVAAIRRTDYEMHMIGHQAVGIDWHAGLTCVLTQNVQGCRRHFGVREDWLTVPDSHSN
jgi:hypothetical protein